MTIDEWHHESQTLATSSSQNLQDTAKTVMRVGFANIPDDELTIMGVDITLSHNPRA